MSIAASGIQTAFARFGSAAASAVTPGADPAAAMTGMAQAQSDVMANLAVLKAADAMSKTLLDITV